MSLNTQPAAVTARVRLSGKKHARFRQYNYETKQLEPGEVTTGVELSFNADYANGANQEWAASTPSVNLTMTVKPELDEFFASNRAFELVFRPIDE